MSDVTVHIDETLTPAALLALQHDLCMLQGIRTVDANERHPHLMVVRYDHAQTDSRSILSELSGYGYHAELIGF